MAPRLHIGTFRLYMANCLSVIFFLLAIALTALAGNAMLQALNGEAKFIEAIINAINMAIVALAIFELGLVVNKEYARREDTHHILVVLRRTVPRFVSIVCIALVLEGLLLVIKYSQLGLAGNLYYPVAIIVSAALLLAALGVFLRLSDGSYQEEKTRHFPHEWTQPVEQPPKRPSGAFGINQTPFTV